MINSNYNKRLKKFARENRNNSTKAEIRIWCELLRNRKMLGYQFLRQRPIGDYIADFMCKELYLIIEIDGYSHKFKYDEDIERDLELNKMGFQVIRFTDDEVENHINNVERKIIEIIETKKIIPLPPSQTHNQSHKGDK